MEQEKDLKELRCKATNLAASKIEDLNNIKKELDEVFRKLDYWYNNDGSDNMYLETQLSHQRNAYIKALDSIGDAVSELQDCIFD